MYIGDFFKLKKLMRRETKYRGKGEDMTFFLNEIEK